MAKTVFLVLEHVSVIGMHATFVLGALIRRVSQSAYGRNPLKQVQFKVLNAHCAVTGRWFGEVGIAMMVQSGGTGSNLNLPRRFINTNEIFLESLNIEKSCLVFNVLGAPLVGDLF